MQSPRLQDILEAKKDQINHWSFTYWHQKTLHAIRRCRTAELGVVVINYIYLIIPVGTDIVQAVKHTNAIVGFRLGKPSY